MATEIFIEPELENLSNIDNATEWQMISEELGLTGQMKLTERSETKQAPPYMILDPKTQRIILALCPVGVAIQNYDQSTIPLDILQEVHKCKEHGWYHHIKVFYDNKTPDPFVVGFLTKEWSSPCHLIGRWGAELLPFELLEQRAIQRLKNDVIEELSEVKFRIEAALSNVEAFIGNALAGKDSPKVQFNPGGMTSWGSELPF